MNYLRCKPLYLKIFVKSVVYIYKFLLMVFYKMRGILLIFFYIYFQPLFIYFLERQFKFHFLFFKEKCTLKNLFRFMILDKFTCFILWRRGSQRICFYQMSSFKSVCPYIATIPSTKYMKLYIKLKKKIPYIF